MSFLKENRLIIVVGFVVVSAGMFLFWRNNIPQEPVVIYKTTQPSKSQTNVENPVNPITHSHNHSHNTTPHSHTVQESRKNEASDWRDDSPFEAPPKMDPWKNLSGQQADTAADSREDSEIYPPPNWHLTEDPELFVKHYRAVLLERFGDIPQVHIVVEDERKRRLGLSQTLDELVVYLEALYYLFPREETLRSLEQARERKAEEGQVNIIHKGTPR